MQMNVNDSKPLQIVVRSPRFWLAIGMVVVAAALRCMPHLPNFSPVTAMALFAGALLPRNLYAFVLPLIALFLSDLVLGFHSQIPAVYGSFVLVTFIGFLLREKHDLVRVGAASISGSVLFFVITNFSVWAEGVIYPRTLLGLTECFVAALPFFRNALAGDLIYSTVFFGVWAALGLVVPRMRTA